MKILVADDHPLILSGVKTTLSQGLEGVTILEASDSTATLRLVAEHQPELLVLDLSMPGLAPDELVLKARETHPALKVLVLTAHDETAMVKKIMRARISGYLLKDEATEHLLQAVRAVIQGAAWFSQTVAQKMMGVDPQENLPDLTPREREILRLIGRGIDNQGIAQELSLAEQTVRNYASTIYEKIGVSSRVEAVVWCHERGDI